MATATATEPARARAAFARVPAWALTVAGALAWLVVDPPTPDLAAHEYRAAVVREAGAGIWEQGWYAGHHLPGYSVLMPLAAALLTPQLVAAIAVVIAAWCFERLAAAHWEPRAARAASLWFAAGVVSTLVGGQLAFAAGLAPALGALLVARRGRLVPGALLGAATTLTSPVTAAFLVLACAAWWLGDGHRRAPVAVAAGAVIQGAAILVAFPGGGTQPFSVSSFAWAFGIALVLALVLPRDERVLRAGALLYAAVLVAGVVFDTPLGGNLVRLAAVFGGPLAAGALWDRRRTALLMLALPLLYWQWLAPVRSVVRGTGDRSEARAYYAPLLAELGRRKAAEGPFRTEIPFTANHWETRWVAPRQPLARGWERQADVRLDGLFYGDKALTPTRYRRWLDELAVRYVALPGAELDPAGAAEGRLVAAGAVPGLREVWSSRDWRLFRVDGARALATPPVRVTAIGLESVDLSTPRPATAIVRVRFTPYWKLVDGRGCVGRGPGGWTRVLLRDAGAARLEVRFALSRIRATSARCSS